MNDGERSQLDVIGQAVPAAEAGSDVLTIDPNSPQRRSWLASLVRSKYAQALAVLATLGVAPGCDSGDGEIDTDDTSLSPTGADVDGDDDDDNNEDPDGGTTGGETGEDSDSDSGGGTTGSSSGDTTGGADDMNESPCEDVACDDGEYCVNEGNEASCEEIVEPGIDGAPEDPNDFIAVFGSMFEANGGSAMLYDGIEFQVENDDGSTEWVDINDYEGGAYDSGSGKYSLNYEIGDEDINELKTLKVRGVKNDEPGKVSEALFSRVL